ncbi:MAG: PIN domain-containing protein [Pyrinomonadaceae bacterium]
MTDCKQFVLSVRNAASRYQLTITDYEDAVQHECAMAENFDAIVTRNTKEYKSSSITVYSPTEFCKFCRRVNVFV